MKYYLLEEKSNRAKLCLFVLIFSAVICWYWFCIANENNSLFLPLPSDRPIEKNIKDNEVVVTTVNSTLSRPLYDIRPVNADIYPFDISSTDVVVYLHMQKTGGTWFGRHLVQDLNVDCSLVRPKLYKCTRPNDDTEWLFSRFTTGWFCGLHAGFTSLSECVPSYFQDDVTNTNRRYFYFTFLREPIARYLSEWIHTARGATWDTAHLLCNKHRYEYKLCYDGPNWRKVSLQEFMDCKSNLAVNRQTRMLSNLRAINCTGKGFSKKEKNRIMLETAKQNLKDMVFFGLLERQEESQFLFEKTFNLHFKEKLEVINITRASQSEETEDEIKRIKKLNNLDIQLYEFASKLFQERYNDVTRSNNNSDK